MSAQKPSFTMERPIHSLIKEEILEETEHEKEEEEVAERANPAGKEVSKEVPGENGEEHARTPASTPTQSPRHRAHSSPGRSRSHPSSRRPSSSSLHSPEPRAKHSYWRSRSHEHGPSTSAGTDRASMNYEKARYAMSSGSKKDLLRQQSSTPSSPSSPRKYSAAAERFLNACSPKNATLKLGPRGIARMSSCTEPVSSDTSVIVQRSSKSQENGIYFTPAFSRSYRKPGTEIAIACMIILVGLVTLLVSYVTGERTWGIMGYVCLGIGALSMILGVCWYCSKSNKDDGDEGKESQQLVDVKIEDSEFRRRSVNSYQSPKSSRSKRSSIKSNRSLTPEAV